MKQVQTNLCSIFYLIKFSEIQISKISKTKDQLQYFQKHFLHNLNEKNTLDSLIFAYKASFEGIFQNCNKE